jgi:hypothetical protein
VRLELHFSKERIWRLGIARVCYMNMSPTMRIRKSHAHARWGLLYPPNAPPMTEMMTEFPHHYFLKDPPLTPFVLLFPCVAGPLTSQAHDDSAHVFHEPVMRVLYTPHPKI